MKHFIRYNGIRPLKAEATRCVNDALVFHAKPRSQRSNFCFLVWFEYKHLREQACWKIFAILVMEMAHAWFQILV